MKTSLFVFGVFGILAVGRTWGLMDEFLIGRFCLLTGLGIGALWFLTPAKPEFKIHWFDIFFLGFYLVSASSLIWAILPEAGYINVQSIGLTMVYYVLFRLLGPSLSDSAIFRAISVCILLSLMVVLYQLILLGLSEGIGGDHIYDIKGWTGHKNLVASFQFLLLGLLVYFMVDRNLKPWYYLIISLQLALILVLRTRAVFLASGVFFLILAVYLLLGNQRALNQYKKQMAAVLLGTMVAGGILFFSLGGTVSDIQKLNPAKYLNSSTGAERRFVWMKTRQLIQDRWFKGYGAGNWKLVFPSKSIDGAWRLQSQNVIFTRAHNDYLEIWSETGLIGILMYLGMFGCALSYLIKNLKQRTNLNKSLDVILLALLVGYLLIAFFDFPKERMEHQVILAFLFALIITRFETNDPPGLVLLSKRNLSVFKIFLSLLLLVNLILGYYTIQGEYHTRKAMEAQLAGNWKLVESESKKGYSGLFKINSIATSIQWYQGLALYHQGKFKEAEAPLALAAKHTPFHFNSLNDYAGCLVQLKKYREAIEIYKKVLFINPKFDDAMFNISYAYSQTNDFDKAFYWVNKTKTLPLKKENFVKEIENLKSKQLIMK